MQIVPASDIKVGDWYKFVPHATCPKCAAQVTYPARKCECGCDLTKRRESHGKNIGSIAEQSKPKFGIIKDIDNTLVLVLIGEREFWTPRFSGQVVFAREIKSDNLTGSNESTAAMV